VLEAPSGRIAILMNEFGEIAIDSRIIEGKNVDIVELAGGCVCCSLTGEFEAAVNEIIDRVHPELIIVEATGVAESDALVFEMEDRLPNIRLDAVICIVDAYAAVKYPQVGYAARTQLAAADVLLINKTDLVGPQEIETVVAQVRKYNPRAAAIKTVRCGAPLDFILNPSIAKRIVPEPTPRSEEFESFAFTSSRMLSREKFEEFVLSLHNVVFRAKGFVRFSDGGSCLFNYVAGRAEFEDFETETTQLVFIGPSSGSYHDFIEKRLHECEV
jgi:G3E family GTPase